MAIIAVTLKRSGYDNRSREIIDLLKSKMTSYQSQCFWRSDNQWRYYDEDRNIENTAYGLIALLYCGQYDSNLDKIVDWLMSKRNGDYWVSTKTTSVVIQAFVNYIKLKIKRTQPNYSVNVRVNNNSQGPLNINENNIFSLDNLIKLKRSYFKPGSNIIKIEKNGKGDLFYSLDIGYYGREEGIKEKSSKELSIKREYFKRVIKENPGSEEILFDYKPIGDSMKLGDLIEARLTIKNKEPLRYLIIEDPLICGGEVLTESSNDEWKYWFANKEVRDEKVSFFITYLEPGEHILDYEFRPELTGDFHVMPAVLSGMYDPKLYIYSKENRLKIIK